jgi:hypothetical protein
MNYTANNPKEFKRNQLSIVLVQEIDTIFIYTGVAWRGGGKRAPAPIFFQPRNNLCDY